MSQIYTGRVENGVVVFDAEVPAPPEGTRVRVEAIDMEAALGDLSRRLLALAGRAKGLPSDLAENLDHYLHGHPKR